MPPTERAKEKRFSIIIDGKEYVVDRTQMTGFEIKALAAKAPQYQVFEEHDGDKPDRLIGDNEETKIREGMKLYSIPPALFG